MVSWFWLFFSFRGRIGRGGFWLAILVNVLASILLDLGIEGGWADEGANPKMNLALFALLTAILSYSAAAVAGKRFHDRGKDGLACAAGGRGIAGAG
jgi:uncharacterized membrane protein YhaH (DUF805 family)